MCPRDTFRVLLAGSGWPLWHLINLSAGPPTVRRVCVLPHRDRAGFPAVLTDRAHQEDGPVQLLRLGHGSGQPPPSFPVVFALRASDHL